MWPAVEKQRISTVFIDDETGLPCPSFDLWEERMGEHTYSTAAVIAGFRAAAEIGCRLGVSSDKTDKWLKAAENMKKALEKELVDKTTGLLLRSVRTKLNCGGLLQIPLGYLLTAKDIQGCVAMITEWILALLAPCPACLNTIIPY